MAREDARWFATAVVSLALVLFLALPVTVLIAIDHLENKAKTKAEIRKELGELKRLKAELKELSRIQKERDDKTVDTKPGAAGGGM
jgi:BarA-like signal transduction histidine kinase